MSVWVYSNADVVELLLNGQSLGIQNVTLYSHVEWNVTWTPGSLQAVGYSQGVATSVAWRNTTGGWRPVRELMTK